MNQRTGGPKTRRRAKAVANGKVVPIAVYARPALRKLIVDYADQKGMRVSNFAVISMANLIAKDKKTTLDRLIPAADFEELQRKRGRALA